MYGHETHQTTMQAALQIPFNHLTYGNLMIKNLLTQIEPVYWYCMGGVILFFALMIVYSIYMGRNNQNRSSL